jgi:prepilin-type N-terminal cleavage/methylation domain-containing protein
MKNQAGITLIEILLVVAIVAILGASATPFLSNFLTRNNHDVAVSRVLGSLRKAQSYSMVQKDGGVWGVCVTGSSLILYRGSCGSPDYQERYSLPPVVSLTGITDISFSSDRGEPSTTGNFTVASSLDSNTITINQGGGISLQ